MIMKYVYLPFRACFGAWMTHIPLFTTNFVENLSKICDFSKFRAVLQLNLAAESLAESLGKFRPNRGGDSLTFIEPIQETV